MKRWQRILISLVICFSLIGGIAYTRIRAYKNMQTEMTTSLVESTPEPTSSPIATDTPTVVIENTLDIESIQNEIEEYLGDDIDYVGIYFYDIDTEQSFGINEDMLFRSASTSKLPAVLCLYDEAYEGTIDIDQLVYATDADIESGTGILQTMDLSEPYTLRELASYALIYSDNIAYNMICRTLGTYHVQLYYQELIDRTLYEDYYDMSAYEGYILLKKLYDNEDDNPYYEEGIEDLKNTIFHTRLDGQIPEEIVPIKLAQMVPMSMM